MGKTILITGSTDGIGLETAKKLVAQGHEVLLHGRSEQKLAAASQAVGGDCRTYLADFSDLRSVAAMAADIKRDETQLDVLINNAGILKSPQPMTKDGLDIRLVVNTLAPMALFYALQENLNDFGRVVNLSSAAQAPVDLPMLSGGSVMEDMAAYSQSKLAITMWSKALVDELLPNQVVTAVNPGSLLASKMVKEGFGIDGKDINIGADILVKAALSDEFANIRGEYYDNDARCFGSPHPNALDSAKCDALVGELKSMLHRFS